MPTSRLMRELRLRRGAPRGRVPQCPPELLPPRLRHDAPPRRPVLRGALRLKRAAEQKFANPELLARLQNATPASVGVGRTGFRYRTKTLLKFLTRFAVAKAAVESQVPEGWGEAQGWLALKSQIESPEQFLLRPDLGRQLNDASMDLVRERCKRDNTVQIVVGDGLSANAVMLNAPTMVASLTRALDNAGISYGTTVFVRYCRSKQIDVIGQEVGARVGIILVGERPGLGTGDGMSAYFVWQPADERIDAEKQAISNIHQRGLPPEEAGVQAVRVIQAILDQQTSGVKLNLEHIS
jgi:ethanolamine ammonia-lyase small subunit